MKTESTEMVQWNGYLPFITNDKLVHPKKLALYSLCRAFTMFFKTSTCV